MLFGGVIWRIMLTSRGPKALRCSSCGAMPLSTTDEMLRGGVMERAMLGPRDDTPATPSDLRNGEIRCEEMESGGTIERPMAGCRVEGMPARWSRESVLLTA